MVIVSLSSRGFEPKLFTSEQYLHDKKEWRVCVCAGVRENKCNPGSWIPLSRLPRQKTKPPSVPETWQRKCRHQAPCLQDNVVHNTKTFPLRSDFKMRSNQRSISTPGVFNFSKTKWSTLQDVLPVFVSVLPVLQPLFNSRGCYWVVLKFY